MKKNSFIFVLLTIVILLSILVGCGDNSGIEPNATTTNQENKDNKNTSENLDEEMKKPDTPKEVCTYEGFSNKLNEIDRDVEDTMQMFEKNPEVTDKFLNTLYGFEKAYADLELYANKIKNEAERRRARSIAKSGYCDDPIETYLYDREYRDFTYEANEIGWNVKYTFFYKDGVYTLGEDYYTTVIWFQNIDTDSKSDAFGEQRSYRVINKEKDAFILMNGAETGYKLVRIVAEGNEVNAEETHPEYTKKEFDKLYKTVYDNCAHALAKVAETGILIDETVQYLLINNQDIEEIYWYGEQLTSTDAKAYENDKKAGRLEKRMKAIKLDESSKGYGYYYEDGILTLTTREEIVVTENVFDIRNHPNEIGSRNVLVDSLDKEGFVLTLGEFGYSLYYFIAG